MAIRIQNLFSRVPALLLLAGILFLQALPAAHAQSSGNQVSLNEVLKRWGFSQQSVRTAGSARWKSKWNQIDVEQNKGYVTLNGVRLWIGGTVTENSGTFTISRKDFDKSLSAVLAPQPTPNAPVVRHVLIDPGHGGKDPGKENNRVKLQEKTLALDVANRLAFILRKNGVRVSFTRTKDVFVELDDRSLTAKKLGADLFVSIHFNAAGSASASGIETFVLTPQGMYSTNDPKKTASATSVNAFEIGNRSDNWNVLFGYYVQSSLTEKTDSEDRGVKHARFAVLKDLVCPGALVECGFLSNASEAALIAGEGHRNKIAQGIADGILKYRQMVQKLVPPPKKK